MYRFEPAEGNNRTDLDVQLESCGINISTEETHGFLILIPLAWLLNWEPNNVKPWNYESMGRPPQSLNRMEI